MMGCIALTGSGAPPCSRKLLPRSGASLTYIPAEGGGGTGKVYLYGGQHPVQGVIYDDMLVGAASARLPAYLMCTIACHGFECLLQWDGAVLLEPTWGCMGGLAGWLALCRAAAARCRGLTLSLLPAPPCSAWTLAAGS